MITEARCQIQCWTLLVHFSPVICISILLSHSLKMEDNSSHEEFLKTKVCRAGCMMLDLDKCSDTPQVGKYESGEGLPYAPVDWPNLGDRWIWKVRKRILKSGYFHDRFLSPPERLQKCGRRLCFASKPEVIRYVQSEFPGADVDSFFASFTWRIPAKEFPKAEIDRTSYQTICSQKEAKIVDLRMPRKRNQHVMAFRHLNHQSPELVAEFTTQDPTTKHEEFLKTKVCRAGGMMFDLDKCSDTPKVGKYESGEGLPYAPVDWPNFGDRWIWKVRKRILKSGYFRDRFLSPPERLQKCGCRLCFASKPEVIRYLQSEFPGADADSFFASFTWRIPAEEFPKAEIDRTSYQTICSQMEAKIADLRMPRKRNQHVMAFRNPNHQSQELVAEFTTQDPTTKVSSMTDEVKEQRKSIPNNSSNNNDSPKDKFSIHNIYGSANNASMTRESCCMKQRDMRFSGNDTAEVNLEDFDSLLNSLNDIVGSHIPPLNGSCTSFREEMDVTRKRISAFLALEFPDLVSRDLTELTMLSSRLARDPNITPEQFSMLRLIQEIPPTRMEFQELKSAGEQSSNFFSEFETKISKAKSLRKEYEESKEKILSLLAEIDFSSSEIVKVDEQTAILQSRREVLQGILKINKDKIAQLKSVQKGVVERLPNVVHEIQLAKSAMPAWEVKKKNSSEKMAKILDNFGPLKGYAFDT